MNTSILKYGPLLFIISLFAITLHPHPATAWEQTMTCNNRDIQCLPELSPLPVQWMKNCAPIHLNEEGYSKIPMTELQSAVEQSIEEWNKPQCAYFKLIYSGLTDENRVGYNPYIKNNGNILVFREEQWENSRTMMALTTVTQNAKTGELLDADIEFNATVYQFTNTENPKGTVDFKNTLTHELGHVIGIAHSDVVESTMFGYADKGENHKSTLHDDDIEAICNIYPMTEENKNKTCKLKPDFYEKPDLPMNQPPPDDACTIKYPNTKPKNPPFLLILTLITGLAIRQLRTEKKTKSGLKPKP